MSFLAKLFINSRTINVLDTDIQFYQNVDSYTFKPTSLPQGGIFTVTVEADSPTDLLNLVISPDTMCKGHIRFYKRDGMSKLTDYEFFDTYIVSCQRNFNGYSTTTDTYVFSPGILRIGDMVFEKPWKITDLNNLANNITPEPITPKPKLSSVKWKTIDGVTIEETTYKEKVTLEVKVANAEGGSVEITIEKEDGTEFEEGTKSLTFTEYLTDEGIAQVSTLKIKEKWEEFKTADVDKLIANVEHNGSSKKSSALKIVPPPKVLADFRPKSNWDAEFGFDWLRFGDTSHFGDNKYEDIVSKQYTDSTNTTLERNQNKYKGSFKKDAKQYKKLKEKYGTFDIPWKTTTDASGNKVQEKHIVQWLALKNGKTAELKLLLDIEEKADYLEFEDNEHFEISPKKIDISGKGKGQNKKLTDIISIKCKKEFTTDQEIIVKAYLKTKPKEGIIAGKIKAWANDATKQKQKKVVFVEIKTPPTSTPVELKSDASLEKDRINKYLNQAFIELHPDSEIVELDLTSDTNFSRFVKRGNLLTISKPIPAQPATATTLAKPAIPREKLIDYLKNKLKAIDNNKYTSYFKAFYFAEGGYHPNGNISGYSAANADYVVVFKSKNDQTAAHELLHAFNLAHTFTNSEATANVEFTYEYKKTDNLLDYSHHISGHKNDRRSLWYWQWIKANNSI